MKRLVPVGLALGILLAAPLPSPPVVRAGAGFNLIAAKKLLVKDSANPARYLVKFGAKDPAIIAAAIDPTVNNGLTFLFGSDDLHLRSNAVVMPVEGWIVEGQAFKYKDAAGTNGPVRKAILVDGKLRVISIGEGFDYPLIDGPAQGTVGVEVYNDVVDFCAALPGTGGKLKKDNPGGSGVYIAARAEAPPMCPAVIAGGS